MQDAIDVAHRNRFGELFPRRVETAAPGDSSPMEKLQGTPMVAVAGLLYCLSPAEHPLCHETRDSSLQSVRDFPLPFTSMVCAKFDIYHLSKMSLPEFLEDDEWTGT